ncbi:MAG: LysM peptidoglycan-binding domain-containing protein [gamma proteobacterium symbiont of Taylorina sp.]|nr:LysM peptidoglycan-binding domain-containing protein [gamma proteobacterium symbiont of Taylorina sp.]
MIKQYLLYPVSYLLVIYFLQACTLVSTLEEGYDLLSQSFSESDEINTTATETKTTPVMESTRDILATHTDSESPSQSLTTPDDIFYKIKFNDVWQRIPSLYQLSNIDNMHIEKQRQWYIRNKDYFERISIRASPFLYLITEEVEKRNMPGEIALLPVVESAFKTNAYSRQKASGLWQFIPATGRYFGLKKTWWYDGRRDVYMSTDAALTYLSQLSKYYKGDWLLALAAYNAGAGNVDKAIKKNRKKGKATDYWSLDLPKETRRYIPKLLAISSLIQDKNKYHLNLHPINDEPYLKLVDTKSQINFALIAKLTGLSIDEIRSYNPAFKQWATDPDGPHHLLLPVNKIGNLTEKLALLSDTERMPWFRHKIRSGENLGLIAQQYKISVKFLKQSNHLKNNHIRAGHYLLVPSSTGQQINTVSIQTSKTNSSKNGLYKVRQGDSFWSISRKFKLSHKKLALINGLSTTDTLSIGQLLKVQNSENKTKGQQKHQVKIITYKVKKGDSLYGISRRFDVSVNELKTWNQLNNKHLLQPGQKIKVYKQTI